MDYITEDFFRNLCSAISSRYTLSGDIKSSRRKVNTVCFLHLPISPTLLLEVESQGKKSCWQKTWSNNTDTPKKQVSCIHINSKAEFSSLWKESSYNWKTRPHRTSFVSKKGKEIPTNVSTRPESFKKKTKTCMWVFVCLSGRRWQH